jgi:ParB family chromosome partitioning protein
MTKRLGRGLAELLESGEESAEGFATLRVDQVQAGRLQPRASMDRQALDELKASIVKSGVLEPILVRPVAPGAYELVAGERRLLAAKEIGLKEVPAIIRALSDKEALELSLVENIQRENLNPMEEANGYARLLEEFGYTQEAIAEAVGKDRATVANLLRLRTLPVEMQEALRQGTITMGHAKALLGAANRERQAALFRRLTAERLTVRQAEALAGAATSGVRHRARRLDPELARLEDQCRQALGTKVVLSPRRRGGRVIIDYFSPEDLARLMERLGVVG